MEERIMKLNKTIILAGAALIVAASCGKLNQVPVWSDADNFAAFDKAKVNTSEDAGSVRIPVTIASVNPIETTVVYSVDVENEKCTAIAGTHFTLADPTGVLTFADGARTAYIDINLIPVHGAAGYTGDKSIILKLDSAPDVNIGFAKSCEVVIADQDHPLAAILGTYTIEEKDHYQAAGTITIEKDPDDVTVVHFPDLCYGLLNWLGDFTCVDITGQVSADMKTIVIPVPYETGYAYQGKPINIYACNSSASATTYADIDMTASSITLTATDNGWDSGGQGIYGWIVGLGANDDWGWGPFTLVK